MAAGQQTHECTKWQCPAPEPFDGGTSWQFPPPEPFDGGTGDYFSGSSARVALESGSSFYFNSFKPLAEHLLLLTGLWELFKKWWWPEKVEEKTEPNEKEKQEPAGAEKKEPIALDMLTGYSAYSADHTMMADLRRVLAPRIMQSQPTIGFDGSAIGDPFHFANPTLRPDLNLSKTQDIHVRLMKIRQGAHVDA